MPSINISIPDDPLLSVIVPVFNEGDGITEFHDRLTQVLVGTYRYEIIYINDGSTDNSLVQIEGLRANDPHVALIELSRNFGKEIAMSAGFDYAVGDAVIVIDADLQDPPELIPELVNKWHEGYDVVYATRKSRRGESLPRKLMAKYFYLLLNKSASISIPRDTGDFRLLSRRAVHALNQLREQHRYMKGLFSWIGYPQAGVIYERDPRHAGHSSWNYLKLWNFALEGITSFTTLPLKFATVVGLLTATAAFLYGGYIIIDTLIYGNPVSGYPSLMVTILFLGGIQLLSIGIIGEYLGRLFDESKKRPLYLINHYQPAKSQENSQESAKND